MRFAEEVVVEEFLPTFRSMLAADLRDRGLTQREVADALGISQSAVSKYAHGGVERNDAFLDDERVRNLVARIGEGFATDSMSPVEAMIETEVLIRRLEHHDLVSELHERQMPALEGHGGDFAVHDPEGDLRTTERVLSSVRRGLRIVERTGGFAVLIPAVGSNLCECTPDADGIDDVAAVPGRIVDIKGRATIPAEPEFGVSEHVASVLLAARKHGSDSSAAFNVKYDPDLVDRLEEMGYVTAEFDAEYDDVNRSVGKALDETPDATVLYHTGGYGIEPITYLLADTAEDAAGIARDLV